MRNILFGGLFWGRQFEETTKYATVQFRVTPVLKSETVEIYIRQL